MPSAGGPRGSLGRYDADIGGSLTAITKQEDGRFVVWGPASVEVIDREDDLVRADALEEALPQLLKRARLSLDHSDQLVGEILEGYETDEPVTVEVDGNEYTRSEFPTGVLFPESDDVPLKGLYVCGEIYDDTQQAQDTRRRIERGEFDSFSISGEAISTGTQFDGGDVIDRIEEMDLSAVTICEEGMNQNAKFALIDKNEQYSIDNLKEELPDDLYEEVADHLSDPKMFGDESDDVMDIDGEPSVEEVREEEEANEPVDKMFTPYSHAAPGYEDVDNVDVSGALEMFYGGMGE